jgi:hypothetical protein
MRETARLLERTMPRIAPRESSNSALSVFNETEKSFPLEPSFQYRWISSRLRWSSVRISRSIIGKTAFFEKEE